MSNIKATLAMNKKLFGNFPRHNAGFFFNDISRLLFLCVKSSVGSLIIHKGAQLTRS